VGTFLFFICLGFVGAGNSTDVDFLVDDNTDNFHNVSCNVVESSGDDDVVVGEVSFDVVVNDYDNIDRNFDYDFSDYDVSFSNSIRAPTVIFITEDSYDSYFNKFTGEIKVDADIIKGDVLKIGNVSNRAFVIDRPLTLTSISSNDTISNGVVHLISGSSGSTVTGLRIINTQSTIMVNGIAGSMLHGIWLTRTNNNIISHNIIRLANTPGVYGIPMGWSSNNTIVYNDVKTYITSCMPMGDSHNNNISYNSLEALSYSMYSVTNVIYFNPYGHADYHGPATCLNNIISNNLLVGFSTGEMCIILMLLGGSNNTRIINNTIVKGMYGISYVAENVTVWGNVVRDSYISMGVGGSNVLVSNNSVSATFNNGGIQVSSSDGFDSNVTVCNNTAFFTNGTYFGIEVFGSNIRVFDNVITMGNYGTGIVTGGNYSLVYDNRINCVSDYGISFSGNNHLIKNNIINTKARGIVINSPNMRFYNNSIVDNTIFSDSYGISIEGLVYYTTISGNVIETNASVGIYKDITDEVADNNSDNMINGVIYDATALVVNDSNFYDYFTVDGYLNYTFKQGKTPTIFFTFLSNKDVYLSEKIYVISNKMNNLLLNVSIYLYGNASGSMVRDFVFYNYGKTGIILDGVSDVFLTGNNLTILSSRSSDSVYGFIVSNLCRNVIISNNNIYINSKSSNAVGINVLDSGSNDFSSDFTISGNSIIIISSGSVKGLFMDSLINSNVFGNYFNIISDSFAYGILTANSMGNPYGLNISSNSIVVYSKSMVYLIELCMSDNSTVYSNYVWGNGSGVYGIVLYVSDNVTVLDNDLNIFGGDLSGIGYNDDIVGNGHSAIFISESNLVNVSNNLIYTDALKQVIIKGNSIVNMSFNMYVVDDFNYVNYFVNNGLCDIILSGDFLLFNNFTSDVLLIVNVPVNVSSYKSYNNFSGNLKFIDGSNNSNVYGLNFNDSSLILSGVFNVSVFNNSFASSDVIIDGSYNCTVFSNNFTNGSNINGVNILNSDSISVFDNYFAVNNSFNFNSIFIENSFNNNIIGNVLLGNGSGIIFVKSLSSRFNNFLDNTVLLNGSSIFAFYGFNNHYDLIRGNIICLNSTGVVTNQSGVYYYGGSSNNRIYYNNIMSYSVNNGDYAVFLVEAGNLFNQVIGNYLISSNGRLRADYAVYSTFALVVNNTPFYVYVSANDGSDEYGDGSEDNPYQTLKFALQNVLNKCIIYLFDGVYRENNLFIDKNITICANNTLAGEVYIDVNGGQLFNISSSGILTVNGIKFFNAHSLIGGSVFINSGYLLVNNSIFYNNSAFYNNSVASLDHKIDYGHGGVILNYGELFINCSGFYNNFAHKGGVLADFGKTDIKNSVFYGNTAVNGGVIFTNTSNELNIVNSIFNNNTAIISLDFCVLNRTLSGWSIETGDRYNYHSLCCDFGIGRGGAIYSNSPVVIKDSFFEYNKAAYGGAISQYSSYGEYSTYKPTASLLVINSTFSNNYACDTRYGNLSLTSNYVYGSYSGGAIYGTLLNVSILNSTFDYNTAVIDGGALCIQSQNGLIDGSVFVYNTAGSSGGALNLFGNFVITNTIINNNSAYSSGGVNYKSYSTYGHMLNNLNVFNSTISNNIGLDRGGGIGVYGGNVSISNSNVVNNFAPSGTTIFNSGGDIRGPNNYWGSKGPDDSVWNNVKNFSPWSRNPIVWKPSVTIPGDNNTNPGPGPGPGPSPGPIINIPSTDNGMGTSNTLNPSPSPGSGEGSGGSGSGEGSGGSGSGEGSGGSGSGEGSGGSGSGEGSGIPGSDGNNNNQGNNGSLSWANSFSGVIDSSGFISSGVVNLGSLSRSNSSNVQNLLSVGMVANAADASSSDSGGGSSSSSSSGSSSPSTSSVYEVSEVVEKNVLDDNASVYTIVAVLVILLVLLIIGYRRQNKEI
jgi:hypothetical protein